jgi:hypothetical protein
MSGTHRHGRPRSWFAVSVIMVGFAVGGAGLILGPSWTLFGAGAVIAALGGVLALKVGVMADVVVEEPRAMRATGAATPVGGGDTEVVAR